MIKMKLNNISTVELKPITERIPYLAFNFHRYHIRSDREREIISNLNYITAIKYHTGRE